MSQAAFRVRRSKREVESLEDNLVETPQESTATAWMSETSITNRYEKKVLNERRHLSFALMVQKDVQQKNTEQVRSLERRVHRLEKQTKKMEAEGNLCNKKLAKLYETQGLTTFLYLQREQTRSDIAKDHEKKRQVCSELRISDRKRLDASRRGYQDYMRSLIKTMKEKSELNGQEKAKMEATLLEANRERYLRVKNEEAELRHRLRRIEVRLHPNGGVQDEARPQKLLRQGRELPLRQPPAGARAKRTRTASAGTAAGP